MKSKIDGLLVIFLSAFILLLSAYVVTLGNVEKNNSVKMTTTITTTTTSTTTTTTKKTTKKTYNNSGYKITHYGPDCRDCSGVTASGYNVKNTIYYNDNEYGNIRIVATGKNIPLYSIIRIKDYKQGDITAIVLDRGVRNNIIDILVDSEKSASKLGIQKNVNIEILRRGK